MILFWLFGSLWFLVTSFPCELHYSHPNWYEIRVEVNQRAAFALFLEVAKARSAVSQLRPETLGGQQCLQLNLLTLF